MTVNGSYQAVSQDVSDTVRAWLSRAKYRISDPLIKPQEITILSKSVSSNMADVLTLRSLLSRNNAANRDLQDCSRAIASKLDSTSRLLNIDSVIRDPEDGSVLIPPYQLPSIVISKQRELSQESPVVPSGRHAGSQPLYAVLDITNIRLPMELIPSSVTARLHLQFYVFMPSPSSDVKISSSGIVGAGETTEPFCLVWDRNSGLEQSWQPKQSAVFDLSSFHWSGTPIANRIYLICVAYRIGTMKTAVLSEESSSKSSCEQMTPNIKRPIGVTVLDLFPTTPVRTESRFHSLRKTRRPSHSSLIDASYEEPTTLLSWQDPNGVSYTLNFGSTSGTLQELAIETVPLTSTIGTPPSLNCCQIDVRLTLVTSPPIVCTNAALKSTKAAPIYVEPTGFLNRKINAGLVSKFYITLLDGTLNRKTNAEVSVYLIKVLQSESGATKSDVLPLFCSTVHEKTDKPDWNEHFQVDVDSDTDSSLHLLFSIRMRSSRTESDKKSERDRFFAYYPLTWKTGDSLVATEDRSSVGLALYRLTHHAKDPSTLPSPSAYMNQEWRFDEMYRKHCGPNSSNSSSTPLVGAVASALSPIYAQAKTIPVGDGVEFCSRNNLNIRTVFCSCQLAQSEKLAKFLSLREKNIDDSADQLAEVFMELDTELWIHLLFPCFDKIFELISFAAKTNNQKLLDTVFTKSLLSILRTLLRSKSQDGKGGLLPIKYLQTSFCSPNCFLPLADALNRSLMVKSQVPNPAEVIVICTKFAVASYRQHVQLSAKLQRLIPENILPDFTLKLNDIVKKLAELSVEDPILRQKCLPDVVELVSHDFCDRSKLYHRIMTDISSQGMSDNKKVLDFYRVLAKSHLANEEGRKILLPKILEKCCEVLDAFSFWSNVNSFSSEFQVAYLALMVLQEVISADVGPSSTNQLIPVLRISLRVACLVPPNQDSHWLAMGIALACGKLLNFDSLERYFSGEGYAYPLEIVDFIDECLVSIEKLFANDPDMKQFASFIYMRNWIIANNVLAEFGRFVIKKLSPMNSDHIVLCLRQFLHTTLTFLLQPTLEVERFPENFNSQRFAVHLGDLRKNTAQVLLNFWNDLQKGYKIRCSAILFKSDASLVQLALSCLPEPRHCACLILKDILKLEFESAQLQKRRSTTMSQVLETQGCVALFLQSLDYLVIKWPQRTKEFYEDFAGVFKQEQGQNDADYVERQVGLLLETVRSQLIFLEDYIAACTRSPNPVAELTCLRRMILFYHKKDLIVPYVTHLSTLYKRQLARQMFAEAASALEELSALVSWTDELPLSNILQNLSLVHHRGTQRSFKEALYEKAAELFQEVKLFERAVLLFRELMKQHLDYTFDYEKLARVHESLAALTRMIATTLRQPPRFFWVTFIGAHGSILPCLQNNTFIFRGPSHQMISDFEHLFKCWFPEVPIRHEPPPLAAISSGQTLPASIHILTVEPDSHETVARKFPSRVPERIVYYYRVNDISRFIHVRTRKQTDGSIKGECFELECAYPMPYSLEWTDVKLEKVVKRDLDAVELAFYDVNKKNIELRAYLDAYQSTKDDAKNMQQDLQRGVKGIVDAPIGGGIFMYAPFFTNSETWNQTSLKQLHEAILMQSQLASEGMRHLKRVMCANVPDLRGLYEFMEVQFGKYTQAVAEIKAWQGAAGSDPSRRKTIPSVTPSGISSPQPGLAISQPRVRTLTEPGVVSLSQSPKSILLAELAAQPIPETRKSADTTIDTSYYMESPKPSASADNLTTNSPLPDGSSPNGRKNVAPPIPPKPKMPKYLRPETNNDQA